MIHSNQVRLLSTVLGLALLGSLSAAGTCAEPVELHTKDSQVLKGEVLFVTATDVQFRTPYGVLKVPRTSVANPEVLAPFLNVPNLGVGAKVPLDIDGQLDETKILALRIARQAPAPLTAQENAKISAIVGRFEATEPEKRPELVEQLRAWSPKANDFIVRAYHKPDDTAIGVELLSALATRGNAGAIPGFAEMHAEALVKWKEIIEAKPENPLFKKKDKVPKRDPKRDAKPYEEAILALEGYAAQTGGAGAALFLLRTYVARYADKKPPFGELGTDARRLFNTAVIDPLLPLAQLDLKSACPWTPLEKALVAERAITVLHGDSRECSQMVRPLLAVTLPENHPKWEATHAEWMEWWRANRAAVIQAGPDE